VCSKQKGKHELSYWILLCIEKRRKTSFSVTPDAADLQVLVDAIRSGQTEVVRSMLDPLHVDKVLNHFCSFEILLRKSRNVPIDLPEQVSKPLVIFKTR